MPVTATNENMEVDNDNNIGEPSTSNSVTNPTPSTSTSTPMPVNVKSDAESPVNSVMASPAIVPSVTVSLHPLVIMNISEHWTRIRAQNGSPQQGLLHIHTHNNFPFISSLCFRLMNCVLCVFSLSQWLVHWLVNKAVAMLRLWTLSNWNSSWSTKTLSFVRITIERKRNNVS